MKLQQYEKNEHGHVRVMNANQWYNYLKDFAESSNKIEELGEDITEDDMEQLEEVWLHAISNNYLMFPPPKFEDIKGKWFEVVKKEGIYSLFDRTNWTPNAPWHYGETNVEFEGDEERNP